MALPFLRTAPEPRTPPAPPARVTDVRRAGLASEVEVHDRQQLEVRFSYAIGSEPEPQHYAVDAWFFVPRNVGVGRANYSREQFYGDVTAHMRLDAAPLPLEQLADPSCPASPLQRFTRALEQFRASPRPPPSRPVAVHVKLYAYLYTLGVRAEMKRLRRLLDEAARPGPRRPAEGGAPAEGAAERAVGERGVGPPAALQEATRVAANREAVKAALRQSAKDSFEHALAGALSRLRRALQAYRQVRSAFWPFAELCHQSLEDAMRSADEYMSLYLEEQLARLAALLQEERLLDGSGFAVRMRLMLVELAREEAAYRAHYGYLVLAKLSEGEYFTYRASLLKKVVHQALYLNARDVGSDRFVRNAVGAVGAALAAIWALATQLPMTIADLPSRTQKAFFAMAVLAYVMKDRIKAVTNEYLTQRLHKYDHVSRLYGPTLETVGLGMLDARLREVMRFLSSAEVPPEVLRMRQARRTVRHAEAGPEEVIHYRKQMEVGARHKEPLPEGYWVRDILRLNVRHFLVRMDDPLDSVQYYDPGRGTFGSAQLPKVYHVNVVLRVRRGRHDGHGQERFESLRLVLNKEGIVRVDLMGSHGPEPFEGKPRGLRALAAAVRRRFRRAPA